MAPSMLSPQLPAPAATRVPEDASVNYFGRGVSGSYSNYTDDDFSSRMTESRQFSLGRPTMTRKVSMASVSNISNVVYSIKQRSSEELGSAVSSRLLSASYESLIEWISQQRMTELPPEGSSYDKVLAWAQLFADRLHSFEFAVQEFAGDSYLAAQLSYGYCSLLLDLGQQNARALMVSFGFFHNMSVPLLNLLQRTELFGVSRDIRDHVVMALSDLVTLVASVATHFHKRINNMTGASVSVNIYSTFSGQIKAFLDRCEKTAELMWTHQLQHEKAEGTKYASIKDVRKWLAPEDHVLESLVSSSSRLAHEREELTCLYIGTHLTRFLRGSHKILSLHGATGCGKSVLASVIADYLQRPIAGITYDTLFVPIDSRIPAEATQRGVARSLLNQLFQKRIGDVSLLKILSDTREQSLRTSTNEAYDDLLWKAVERAMAIAVTGFTQLVLVVDGLDECAGGETALYRRLHSICTTKGAASIKLIVTGANHHEDHHAQDIHLDEDLIFDDIMKVIDDYFGGWKLYESMSEMDREALVSRIVAASNGTFTWAKQASRLLRRQESVKGVDAALKELEKSSVHDLVVKTLSAPEVSEEARLLLTWLVTAERPLGPGELALLAGVNVEKQTLTSEPKMNVTAVLSPVSSLIYQQDGLVQFRHASFRQATIDFLNNMKGAIKDRHGDLAIRLLVYINSAVAEEHKCSLTILSTPTVHQLTTRSHLLDFAVRYWPTHLRKSLPYYKTSHEGDSNAAKLVGKFLPKNVTVWLLQASLWEHRPAPVQLMYYTMLSAICRQLFTTKSMVTLQVLIYLGNIYRQVDFTPDAITCFHEAATVAHVLLTAKSTISIHLCKAFLELTSTRLTTAKSDIMVHREQIMLILVECYTIQYGESSEYVVSTYKLLIEHYRMIKEEKKAAAIIVKINIITGTVDVKVEDHEHKHIDGSLEAHLRGRSGHKHHGGVGIDLYFEEECDESLELHGGAHWDFEVLILRAEKYVRERRFELAEHTYVEIWQRVNREFRISHSSVWEERKLRIVVCYAKFLMTQETRVEYAKSILSIAYAEFRSSTVVITEETSSWYLEISIMMKTVGLISESLTIMKKVSSFFQSTKKTETSTYKELQISIETTSKEIFKSISSSTSTTTTISEEMIEEMVLEQSKSITTIVETTFTATFSLVRIYIAEHRWHDSSRLLKQILRGIWPSLFAANIEDVIAPTKHVERCIEMATRLADCYLHRRRRVKEGDIRVRVYRAMRSSCKVDSKLREKVVHELVHYYKCTEQTELLIVIRQEMLDDYTCHYGAEHAHVIKLLWELAALTRPRPIFIEYYQKIIRTLHKHNEKGIIICHDVFEPFIIVATELYNKGQFTESMSYYKVIFSTFLHDHKCHGKFSDAVFARTLFERYTHCLRTVRTEFTVLHSVCVEYQKQCKVIFGMSATITIHATLHLAKLCMESKRYEAFAIELFELLLTIKCVEIDHGEICGYLDSIYESQTDIITSTTTTTTTTTLTTEQVKRAIKTLKKRVTTIRETHGWAHEESLTKMSELVKFYSSQTTTTKEEETTRIETIMTELREATVHILSKETSSVRLIAAASTIASCYVSAQLVHKAVEIKEELYRQIILKSSKKVTSCGYDFTQRNREVLVFLAEFEYSLCQHRRTITVTDILAELTTQYIYFAEFRTLISAKTYDFCALVVSTARLHGYLQSCERNEAAEYVFAEFVQCFSTHSLKKIKFTKTTHVTIFLQSLLRYFSRHRSTKFVRSVCVGGVSDVQHLLKEGKFDAAMDMASAVFAYVCAQPESSERDVAKMMLIMGLTLAEGTGVNHGNPNAQHHHHHHHGHGHAGREHSPPAQPRLSKALPQGASAILVTRYLPGRPTPATMAQLLNASKAITHFALDVLLKANTNMSLMPLPQLNRLVSIVGAQRDYEILSRLLTSLWTSSRDNCSVAAEQRVQWPRYVTVALSRRVILSRYLVGDTPGAVRLAEDVVYNSRRVHGSQHGRTLDMAQFLAGMYTAVAMKYIKTSKDGKTVAGMPARYLKKAAAIHEGVLRSFSEAGWADMEGPGMMQWEGSNADARSSVSGATPTGDRPIIFSSNADGTCGTVQPRSPGTSTTAGALSSGDEMEQQSFMPVGERVRLHFRLLKLAVQRLGAWPKDFKEYQRLNADVFREFADSMRGVEGVEKWDLGKFGKGIAEGSDDILDIDGFKDWNLLPAAMSQMMSQHSQHLEEEEEEEL